jgi:hypothetical protein
MAAQWINVSEQAGLQKSIVFTRGAALMLVKVLFFNTVGRFA